MEWTPDSWLIEQRKLSKTLSIDRYRTDAVVVRTYECTREVLPPEDSSVGRAPSRKSLQRLVFLLNNCDVPMTSMVTITYQADVSLALGVLDHKRHMHAALQRLRRQGGDRYIWVREFTERGIPHWHLFTNLDCSEGVDEERSIDWSQWHSSQCWKDLKGAGFDRHLIHMADGDGKDFRGCVRVERLRDDAAGRYAGKEGAKRFQKIAPPKWAKSGRWWAPSRNIKCTPTDRVQVLADSLASTKIELENGTTLDVPFRLQFSKGKKS